MRNSSGRKGKLAHLVWALVLWGVTASACTPEPQPAETDGSDSVRPPADAGVTDHLSSQPGLPQDPLTVRGASSESAIRNEDLTHRQVFPDDNWWNVDISQAPVESLSGRLIETAREDSRTWGKQYDRLHPNLASGVKRNIEGGISDPYGIPYLVVSGDQPLHAIRFSFPDESDHEWVGRPGGYPIPDQVLEKWGWIQHGVPGGVRDQTTRLIIVDRDNWVLYELRDAKWDDGQGWSAESGAVFDLDANDRRPEGWRSADAAGLAIFPGLLRADEVFGAGEINHALRIMLVRTADYHVWPASRTTGVSEDRLPAGARLRLKEDFDISGYSSGVQKVFRAFKKYGLIVVGNGGPGFVTGTMDERWNNDIWNPAFQSINLGDFEVIELGWNPFP